MKIKEMRILMAFISSVLFLFWLQYIQPLTPEQIKSIAFYQIFHGQ